MGTYSYFRLEIIHPQENQIVQGEAKQKIMQELFEDPELNNNRLAQMALANDGQTNDECTWYDAEQDISKLSLRYPDLIFILGQRLCCPESAEEEGEFFLAFQQGNGRRIHEPPFMKAAPEFVYYKNLDALKESMNIFTDDEDKTNFLIFVSMEEQHQAQGIFKRLSDTSLSDSIDMSLRSSMGETNFVIQVKLDHQRENEFWNVAENTLVMPL